MATIGKKFGQFRQWTGERLGTSEKTHVSEDFRKLDLETESRKDGVEKLTIALTDYAKTLDKKSSQDKKTSAMSMLAKAMIQQGNFHGEVSTFGIALVEIGKVEDRIQGLQQEYSERVRKGLLMEAMALSASMKDYTSLKKKMENRRLDYDAKLNKFNKSKRDKPGLEEEMRTAQSKYNETLTDVENIMSSFAEREELLLGSLLDFAKAQHDFFAKSLEGLKDLQDFLSEEKLRAKVQENASSNHHHPSSTDNNKAILIRKNSHLKTVLPASLDSECIKPGKNRTLAIEEEKGTGEGPQPISNLSRRASLRGDTGHPPPIKIEMVKVLYEFTGENDGEMSIKPGDLISVTEHVDDGWWLGTCNGKSGIFPANYVKRADQPIKRTEQPAKRTEQPVKRTDQPVKNKSKPYSSLTPSMVSFTSTTNDDHHVQNKTPLVQSTSFCRKCDCQDFNANVFKPGKCNNCFHEH